MYKYFPYKLNCINDVWFCCAAARISYIRLPGNLKCTHPSYHKNDRFEWIRAHPIFSSTLVNIDGFVTSWTHTNIKNRVQTFLHHHSYVKKLKIWNQQIRTLPKKLLTTQ